jgi:hypothetical protein
VFKREVKGLKGLKGFDPDLAAGLEALLSGAYVEYLEHRGDYVPPWAWTNLLAHAGEDRLRRAATSRDQAFRRNDLWRQARSYLAGEVLDSADRTGSLSALQSEALVPLELDLVWWIPSRYAASGQWAARVLAALEDHQRAVTGR